MSGRRVVERTFRRQVGEELGGLPVAHPVVGVGAAHAVLGVLVRVLGRARGSRHSGHRTPSRAVAALALVSSALIVPLVIGQPASAEKRTTFTVALTSDVDSFNPFLGVEANSYEMWALNYDFLVNYKMTDMSPAPGLAEKWEVSPDGKRWTFHMRDGVLWSDGQDLTANDVRFTYDRVLHGKVEGTNWSTYLNNVTSVDAPDAHTIVLNLSKPNAVLPLLPIPILPEHVWSKVSEKQMKTYDNEPSPGHPTVGSGPFQTVSGTAGGSTYVFKKNPHYWGEGPHVDEVVYRVYKSKDPAVQALIKGEVDFVEDINPLQVKALQGKKGIEAHNGISPLFEEIGFNTGAVDTKTGKPIGDANPAVLDKRFRHALGYAVDNERLVKSAYQGAAEPGTTIVPSAYKGWHWEPPADVKFHFDLQKAGEELDAAGYKKGSDGKRTLPNGKPIGTLRLFARSDSKPSVDTMTFFSEWLKELGIDSKVTPMDSGKLYDVILAGNYDAFQWDWYVEPDPDSILSDFTCAQRGGLSDSWYCNKEYDSLYQQQNGEMDHAKRVEMVKKMQQILYEDSPYIVTAYTGIGEAVRTDRFACFQPQPDPGGVWLVQYGGHNYTTLRPASQAGDCDGVKSAVRPVSAPSSSSDSGSSTTVLVVGGVVVLLLVAAGGLFAVRRRSTAGERE